MTVHLATAVTESVDVVRIRRVLQLLDHITMSLHILHSLFLIVCCSPIIAAGCADQYKPVRSTPNGPAVCGVGNPETTHVVRSVSVCSAKCSMNGNCQYFNYITSSNQQPACHLYNSQPQSTIVDPECTLFAVTQNSSSLLGYFIL